MTELPLAVTELPLALTLFDRLRREEELMPKPESELVRSSMMASSPPPKVSEWLDMEVLLNVCVSPVESYISSVCWKP